MNIEEYTYIRDLLINYYNNGYENYFCSTMYKNSSAGSPYEISCIISKEEFEFKDNYYLAKSGKSISFDSSSFKFDDNVDRLNISDLPVGGQGSYINTKEYNYSNSVGYPDILGDYSTSLNNHVDLNLFMLIPCLLLVIFLSSFLRSVFKNRG